MSIKILNEGFEKIFSSVKQDKELKEAYDPALKELSSVLLDLSKRIKNGKINCNLKSCADAFQNIIENMYPDKSWWEVTDVNIQNDLFDTQDPEKTALNIIKNIREKSDRKIESLKESEMAESKQRRTKKPIKESLRRKRLGESEKEPTIKRYSDVRPRSERKYWYFTTHGVQPGSIPRDLNVLEIRDGQNDRGTWGTYVMLDGVLNTSELKYYDMRELAPKEETERRRMRPQGERITAWESYKKKNPIRESYDEKIVIYKDSQGYKATPESNYRARIQNARKIQNLKDFNSADEIIDYYVKYGWAKGRDDFEVIDECKGSKRNTEKTLKEETDWDAYAEIEKGQLDDYTKRVKNEITPQVRRAFSKLKSVLDNEDRDTNVKGIYYPQKAIDMLNGGNRYHMNKYMDLNVSDTLDMIDENGSVEEAIDSLFADYRPSSAYSWASNFVDTLKKLSQKRESFKRTKALKENKKKLTESFDDMEVFMNTWANYNENGADSGITPTGWMSIDDAIEYCEEYADYEPFINDTDNVPFDDINEYSNASSVLQELKELQESDVDEDVVAAIVEATGYGIKEAVEIAERGDYYWYPGISSYTDLAYAVIDEIGSLKDALGDRVVNYIDEDQMRREYRWDIREIMRDTAEQEVDDAHEGEDEDSYDREQEIEDWMDEHEDEYLDMIIDEDIRMAEAGEIDLSNYFDYEAFGRDLSLDGYTIVDGGIILVN